MGETLIGIRYGLAPDKLLEAHQVLISGPGIIKTPYQLDLEVKDRKPSITPKVGDKVKIKSREWYEKWKNSEGCVNFNTTGCVFAKGMEDLCGRELTVRDILDFEVFDGKRWRLSMGSWLFVPEMFEEVYPAQEQASAAKPKTPYQLDLETKDRKPDVVPKVGDKVKIKSREWYEKWKDSAGRVRFDTIDCVFVNGMKDLCGRELTVRDIIKYEDSNEKRWKLSISGWSFVPEMFEEVYPVQEQVSACFPRIDLNSMADFVEIPLTVPSFSVKGGELIVAKTTVGSMIEDTAKRISAYTSVQGLAAKPKLKQVKTTRLLKLKKL